MFTTDYSSTGSGTGAGRQGAPALDFSSLNGIMQTEQAKNKAELPVNEDFAPLPLPTRAKAENAPESRTDEKRANKGDGESKKRKFRPVCKKAKKKVKAPEEQAAELLEVLDVPELPKECSKAFVLIDHYRSPEKEYLKARLQCSQQQAAILKQLRAGESIYSLFLQAMKALSLLTGEEITYTVAEKELKAVYGYGLEAPDVLQTLLSEAGERLKKLEAAEQAEKDKTTDEYKRICGAIAAHKQRIAELEAKAKNAAGT